MNDWMELRQYMVDQTKGKCATAMYWDLPNGDTIAYWSGQMEPTLVSPEKAFKKQVYGDWGWEMVIGWKRAFKLLKKFHMFEEPEESSQL